MTDYYPFPGFNESSPTARKEAVAYHLSRIGLSLEGGSLPGPPEYRRETYGPPAPPYVAFPDDFVKLKGGMVVTKVLARQLGIAVDQPEPE